MPSNREIRRRASFPGAYMRAGRALIAVVLLAAPLTLRDDGRALADDITPVILPDRIDDVLSTPPDPYPTFDNFAWRAFVSLNSPSLTGPDGRGVPDRAKALGDPGPRVWETFKSRYELFQVAPDGRPSAPHPRAAHQPPHPPR